MSHQPRDRTFWFRGNAVAFGGQIESPICETLDAQGSSVLPPTGGFASASVGGFNYKNIVAFERASSTVAGRVSEHDGQRTYDTQVTVAVEGLNVLDMVTADRVVARLTSTHPEEKSEAEMLPIGSYFENLRIAGVEVEMTPHPELARAPDYATLTEVCVKQFGDIPGNPKDLEVGPDPEIPAWRPGQPSLVFQDRLILAPLFEAAEQRGYPPAGAKTVGGTGIYVPNFGTIYLGEYLITRHSRRLTMLRIELGCPVRGTVVAASGENNGHLWP